jgi:hypothetical protein
MQTVRIIRQIITIDTSLFIRNRRIKVGKVYIFKVIYLSPIFIFIIIFGETFLFTLELSYTKMLADLSMHP